MYAIVDIAGQQFKVEKDQKLYVHRLKGDEGKKVQFDRVLLIDTGKKISVGNPVISGATVAAKIISHVKGDKVLVFKKKRRKGYKKLNGHRQYLTQIQIEGITEKAGPKESKPAAKPKATAAEKTTAAKPKAAAASAKKPAAKPKAAASGKKPAAKPKAAASGKKPAAKKPAAKPAAKKDDKS